MKATTKVLASVLLLALASLAAGDNPFLCVSTTKKPSNVDPFTVINAGVTVKSAGYFQLLNETENYYPLNFTSLRYLADDYSSDMIVRTQMAGCSLLDIHLTKDAEQTAYTSNKVQLFLEELTALANGCTAENPGIKFDKDGKFSAKDSIIIKCFRGPHGAADAIITFTTLEIDLGKNKQADVEQKRVWRAVQPLV